MLSFHDLEMRYGAVVAFQCLTEIEKASHIRSCEVSGIDPEQRMHNAITIQDEYSRRHCLSNEICFHHAA